MPTRIAGSQPGYLPWLGWFDLMRRVDAFVIADEMQFSSGGWAHRNRVRGPHGAVWLTLPARPEHGQRIVDVPLDGSVSWRDEHLQRLHHFYRRSPFAADVLPALAAALDQGAARMVDASIPTIRFLAQHFGVATPLVVSSEAGLERRYRETFPDEPGATHRIIAFMKALGATVLVNSETARAYLDVDLCAAHGIRVELVRYRHPVYRQLHEPFVPYLSALDALCCLGDAGACELLAESA